MLNLSRVYSSNAQKSLTFSSFYTFICFLFLEKEKKKKALEKGRGFFFFLFSFKNPSCSKDLGEAAVVLHSSLINWKEDVYMFYVHYFLELLKHVINVW